MPSTRQARLLQPRPTLINMPEAEEREFVDDREHASVHHDNTSAITIIQDRVYNGRTKHIDVRLKQLRELVRDGVVLLRYISTHCQLADVLTKGLLRPQHWNLILPLFTGGNPGKHIALKAPDAGPRISEKESSEEECRTNAIAM